MFVLGRVLWRLQVSPILQVVGTEQTLKKNTLIRPLIGLHR